MKKSILKGALLSLALCSLGTVVSCGATSVDNSRLVIGMECNYQPFNWTEQKSNEFTLKIDGTNDFADGYDIAVAKYLSEDLNKEVVIKRLEWGSLIPSLNSGEINMVLAGMTNTEERRQAIDFTNPYLSSELAFLVRTSDVDSSIGTNENPASYSELLNIFNGKSLVCQANVVGDDFIETYFVNNNEGKTIRHSAAQNSYPLAANDVLGGISFAMPAELPVIEAMTNLNKDKLRVLYCDYTKFLSADDINGLSVSIGIKKGNEELKEELNTSLSKLSNEKRGVMMGEAAKRSANNA